MSEWLLEGRHVETPCPGCGVPTYPALAHAWDLLCIDCGRAKHGAVVATRPAPGANNHLRMGQGLDSVGFSHVPRLAVELERRVEPMRTGLLRWEGADVLCDQVGVPSTVLRLAGRRGGEIAYAAAWFCEGKVDEQGFDAFTLREVLVVRWSLGFATWSRSGRGGWKSGKAFRREDGVVSFGPTSGA